VKLGAVLSIVLLAGCPKKTAVWVKDGSTSSRIAFGVSDTRQGTDPVLIGIFRVDSCGQPNDSSSEAEWLLISTDDAKPLSEVIYGQAPTGYTTAEGPTSLSRGCYRVTTSGTGRTMFQVDADGAVREVAK
jgi:hypothetical protein